MAIFTGEDLAEVMLLNQLVQLEFDPVALEESELLAWARLKGGVPAPEWETSIEPRLGFWTPEIKRDWCKCYGLNEVARAWQLLRRVFSGLVERGRISRDDGQKLERLVDHSRISPHSVMKTPKDVDEFSPKEICWIYDTEKGTPLIRSLATQVESLLNWLSTSDIEISDALRRCPGCESIFFIGRADQRICSQRCHKRLSARRYRKKPTLWKREAEKIEI